MRILFSEYTFDKWFNNAIAALSAYLKRAGHEVFFVRHVDSLKDDHESDYAQALREIQPDMVCLTTMTFQWSVTQKLARIAKSILKDIPVVVGGYHSTFNTHEVISCPYVDFACVGEGEEPLLDLVESFEGKNNLSVSAIPSLWAKRDGRVIENPVRPPVKNLDDLPFWDRSLFEYDKILTQPGRGTVFHEAYLIAVAACRGCPWTCTYCSNESYLRLYKGMGRYPRVRSVPHLMDELKEMKERYKVTKFEFWDEVFGVNPKWMEEFSQTYRREFPDTPFTCFLRMEQTKSDRFLRHLADAGCSIVLMGLESGDEGYRKKYLGRTMSNRELIKAFSRVRDYGIETTSLNMMGLPFETLDQMRQTIAINRQIMPDVMCVFVFQPFKGTILYDLCEKEGWLPQTGYKPAWLLSPDLAIRQPSVTPKEIAVAHQEFLQLQGELEERRKARQRSLTMRAAITGDPDPTHFISM